MHAKPAVALCIAAALIATGLLSGCDNASPDPEVIALQEATLSELYYRGAPRPPAPEPAEIESARTSVKQASDWEREVLEDLYPGDPERWAYAIRDTDNDGIQDFRVSDYYGKFMEGDVDLDGDGLDNYVDADPFVADAAAPDTGSLPAHLDWARQDKPAEMAKIQADLFRNHGILLVERSAPFTPQLAVAVRDVIERVYPNVFMDGKRLRTLRVIATEEASLLHADDEENGGEFAQVIAATQTMIIYRVGIDAAPIIQLGFLAHEIAHNLQYDFDFDAQRQAEIVLRNLEVAPNFHALVAQYGWTATELPMTADGGEFRLFRPQYIAPDTVEYRYRDDTPDEWIEWLDDIYEEVGHDAYLTDARLTDAFITGDYAMSNPWEWYSENVIAYVYLAMVDSVRDQCSEDQWLALTDGFLRDTIEAEWPLFRFENARGAPIMQHLGEAYPMQPADIAYLAERYLLSDWPSLCSCPE